MQRLEVSVAVRPIHGSLGVKRLINSIRYTCCVIDLIPPPINLYTQRGWHISESFQKDCCKFRISLKFVNAVYSPEIYINLSLLTFITLIYYKLLISISLTSLFLYRYSEIIKLMQYLLCVVYSDNQKNKLNAVL